jgi:hypothetical protein
MQTKEHRSTLTKNRRDLRIISERIVNARSSSTAPMARAKGGAEVELGVLVSLEDWSELVGLASRALKELGVSL